MHPSAYDAVVLAGGRSSRFGSDKLAAVVDGVPLLDRVLAATAGARQRVVVGEPRPVAVDVVWTRERPPVGGPAAGVVAGLELVTAPWVALLAGDLPYVGPGTLGRLLAAGQLLDGALLVDAAGRRQILCSVVATDTLRQQAAERHDWHGCSLHSLLGGLRLAEVSARAAEAHDVDFPHDLDRTQEAP
jgi:molybdopterin-guanine dinucleotide biosynthesis protein A